MGPTERKRPSHRSAERVRVQVQRHLDRVPALAHVLREECETCRATPDGPSRGHGGRHDDAMREPIACHEARQKPYHYRDRSDGPNAGPLRFLIVECKDGVRRIPQRWCAQQGGFRVLCVCDGCL